MGFLKENNSNQASSNQTDSKNDSLYLCSTLVKDNEIKVKIWRRAIEETGKEIMRLLLGKKRCGARMQCVVEGVVLGQGWGTSGPGAKCDPL